MEKPPTQTIHVDASILDSLFKPHAGAPAVVTATGEPSYSYDVLRRLDNIEAALARIEQHLGPTYQPTVADTLKELLR